MSTGFWLLETTSSYNRFHNRVEDSALVVPEIKVEFHSDVLKLRADFCLNWKICGLLRIYEVIHIIKNMYRFRQISIDFDKKKPLRVREFKIIPVTNWKSQSIFCLTVDFRDSEMNHFDTLKAREIHRKTPDLIGKKQLHYREIEFKTDKKHSNNE